MGRSRFFPLPDPQSVSSDDAIRWRIHVSPTLAFWSVHPEHAGQQGDALRFTSLAAHPAWRSLGLLPGELPDGLEDLCFSFLHDGHDAHGAAAPSRQGERINPDDVRRIVRDVHAGLSRGVFTGI
jgi:hypothetical protein